MAFGTLAVELKNDIILPVKVGHGRTVLHPECEERKIVHKALEYQTFLSALPSCRIWVMSFDVLPLKRGLRSS